MYMNGLQSSVRRLGQTKDETGEQTTHERWRVYMPRPRPRPPRIGPPRTAPRPVMLLGFRTCVEDTRRYLPRGGMPRPARREEDKTSAHR